MRKEKNEDINMSTSEKDKRSLDRPIRFVEREIEYIGKISKGTNFDEMKKDLDPEKLKKMSKKLQELLKKYRNE